MGLKKKKNIIILTLCMVICFILYQLYFFFAITSEAGNNRVVPVLHIDHEKAEAITHLRTEEDQFINTNGLLRGVLYSHMLRYRPDYKNEFTCLKTEQKIPFEQVNDDYCDCEDGSDEPSTSACVNGTFYCDTQYRGRPLNYNALASSRVNDGICDCCDGSDEWKHDTNQKLLSQTNTLTNTNTVYRYYVTKCPNICQHK